MMLLSQCCRLSGDFKNLGIVAGSNFWIVRVWESILFFSYCHGLGMNCDRNMYAIVSGRYSCLGMDSQGIWMPS